MKSLHWFHLLFNGHFPNALTIGGPYGNFAGRDASRGLAKNSFDMEMLTDDDKPIDKLEDLNKDEWDSLREWEQHFANKYLLVGTLVENP